LTQQAFSLLNELKACQNELLEARNENEKEDEAPTAILETTDETRSGIPQLLGLGLNPPEIPLDNALAFKEGLGLLSSSPERLSHRLDNSLNSPKLGKNRMRDIKRAKRLSPSQTDPRNPEFSGLQVQELQNEVVQLKQEMSRLTHVTGEWEREAKRAMSDSEVSRGEMLKAKGQVEDACRVLEQRDILDERRTEYEDDLEERLSELQVRCDVMEGLSGPGAADSGRHLLAALRAGFATALLTQFLEKSRLTAIRKRIGKWHHKALLKVRECYFSDVHDAFRQAGGAALLGSLLLQAGHMKCRHVLFRWRESTIDGYCSNYASACAR